VGNFTWQKGHDLLVRAAESVQSQFPQTTFRILGTSTPSHAAYYSKHVKKLAARMGLLWGNGLEFVEPGDPISELLPAFDIFVMPSRVEGVPTSILEAMACGLPVIATDVGAVREVVEQGATGRMVAPGNSGALADAISELLLNPQLRAQMGALARQRAVECYDVNICADKHQAAYELAQSVKPGRLRARASARQGMSELGR
jgi:glycosyltransferase involved in cell wall biosynthesis